MFILYINDKKIYDSAIPEKFNVKLCKYILGSEKYSVNDAVHGELGRYPVMIKVLSNGLNSFKGSKTYLTPP